MKYFDMFAGIGGFALGIQQAYEPNRKFWQEEGVYSNSVLPNNISDVLQGDTTQPKRASCVGYSEIDKYAIQIYEKHFNHKNYGDATKINAEELPDFDLLVGGFPCQAFSIAGKRGGLEDSRGTLFYDIARIAKEKRPQHLLLENVKGLLSHDSGRTFKLIISTFAELGYNLEWQVLNSKNFGVPQNRERVFIIGHLGRCCGRQVFPLGEADPSVITTSKLPEQISNTLRTNYSNGKSNEVYVGEIQQLNQPTHSNDRVYGADGISPTLNTMQGGNRQPFILPKSARIRRLTPTECERLQAYPDGWTKYGLEFIKKVGDKIFFESDKNLLIEISDTQRYKTLGNGVTVNVVQYLINKLYD